MRTAESIEATRGDDSAKKPTKNAVSGKARRLANLVAPWTSETAPRNGGRPKKDMAQIIARQIFENNPELLYKAYAKALAKGQAFAFQVLSDRAYGKLVQKQEVTGKDGGPLEITESNDADIAKRISDLERDLGLARAIDEAGRTGSAQAGTGSAGLETEDPAVLPR